MNVPESYIQSLVARLDKPDVIGIAMTGSQARGDVSPFSDVDLRIYVETLPVNEFERYVLRRWDHNLVSLTSVRIEDEVAAMSRPWTAIWAVPGLQQMRILLDRSGKLAALLRTAMDFDWTKLQPAADEYFVEELMGFAEEARKILRGLACHEESTVLWSAWGLVKGMAGAVATQRGLLIQSDNQYLDTLQDAMGRESEWTLAFRAALGADVAVGSAQPYRSRGAAALALYRSTFLAFKSIDLSNHREVIEFTLRLIEEAGY